MEMSTVTGKIRCVRVFQEKQKTDFLVNKWIVSTKKSTSVCILDSKFFGDLTL